MKQIKDLILDLKSRGVINNISNEDKINNLKMEDGIYIGFDPTATSLHLGNYIPITILKRFQKIGFNSLAVLGGATGMIGDPSFKDSERVLLDNDTILTNKAAIKKQLESFGLEVVDNYDFYKDFNFLDFLREVGKNITINYMMAKDSVSSRIESGLSFTEFSYQLIQGNDFKVLYEKKNIKIQAGGSDQWGNITTGLELIRKSVGENNALGLTINLLTDSNGNKFGKSVGKPIWLNKEKTSSFSMYQYLLNQNDADVEKLLKWYTYFSMDKIEEIMSEHNQSKGKKFAQKTLAFEVTKDIRGNDEAVRAEEITAILFEPSKDLTTLSMKDINDIKEDIPFYDNQGEKINVIDLLIAAQIATSKREAREFLSSKTILIDGLNVENETDEVVPVNFEKKYLLIKKGKRSYYLIKY